MLLLLTAALVVVQGHTVTLAPAIAALIGVFLPLITALVTKLNASATVKAVAAAVLAVITGIAVTYQQTGSATFDWWVAVMSILSAFVTQATTYAHLWKPIGDSGEVPFAIWSRNFGLGGSAAQPKP